MAIPTWSRRRFLRAAGLAGLAPLAVPHLAAGAENWSHDFARALETNPVLLGWRGVGPDRLQCTARVEGRLPVELQGTLYRNGPAVHERFGLRYRHLFEGDGMVQAFRFDGRGVTHRARVLATPKLVRETEAGRRLFSGFATEVHDGSPVRRPDDVNAANISVLDHHGELLALWEGGSASVLDRATLEWRGFKVWGEGLEGLPFTAHPRVEPDGTLWAFGYIFSPAPALVLYHIGADGTVVKAKALNPGPLGIVHDFVVTARHLVIVIPPLVFEPARVEGMLLDAFVWRPDLGSRVLVVDKDDFSSRRWYQLPAGFGFHHGNGWEDASGTIRFDFCVAADATLMTETMRGVMRGDLVRPAAGEWETSFMLYAYPDLVDMSDVPVNVPEVDRDLFPAHIPGDPRIDGNTYQLYPTLEEYRRSSEPGEGATGDPTLATKEKGRIIFEAMVRNITSVVMAARKHEVTIRNVRVPA